MGAPDRGRVYLVGAGPGDPGLLGARAIELLAAADVILYDALVPAAALLHARADAELVYVGKRGGAPMAGGPGEDEAPGAPHEDEAVGAPGARSVPQGETEALMVRCAVAGKTVVRLKGGDPFVFGRGGEEAMRLREAGIPFEVVPGVTAGLAAAAYAGIPATHRGLASAVALVTGHEDPAKGEGALDWEALARFPGTLVLYMAVESLDGICAALIAAGRPGSQPAAVIEWGTLPWQRTVTGSLGTIAERAAAAAVAAPAITVLGEVAELGAELGWFEGQARALSGRTVAVTRARPQASELARRLEALGARVLQAPSIEIRPLAPEPLDPAPYDLICLTSPNGVEAFVARLRSAGRDARALAGCRVAAIGPGTARALAGFGITADVVPERFVAEGLVEALVEAGDIPPEPARASAGAGETPPGGRAKRALVARARAARDVLPEALRARGMQVDVLALYETVAHPLSPSALQAAGGADYITFTSSSTVRFFLDALRQATGEGPEGALAPSTRVVSIGPATSETLREHGLQPAVEAERHDIDGLIDALVSDAAAMRPSG